MDIDLCALADYANTGEGGKLNIVGVFDSVGVAHFPAVHQSLVLVLRLHVGYEDSETEHDLLIRLEKPDGDKVLQLEGKVSIGTVDAGQFRMQNHIMRINNLPLEASGTHLFRVFIDGELKAEKPLRVVQRG